MEPTCEQCDGELKYLEYTVRVGNSDTLHVFKCKVCEHKQYLLTGPKTGAVKIHNN